MRGEAKLALALWAVLAIAVFSVTFDWQTRQSAWQFMGQQHERRAQGRQLATIEEEFRPMMQAAARQSARWLLLILAGGMGAVLIAARRDRRSDA